MVVTLRLIPGHGFYQTPKCNACCSTNLLGKRYVCLICTSFDLCGSCHDAEACPNDHTKNHPMQAVCTKPNIFNELIYAVEIPDGYKCPFCEEGDFDIDTLVDHLLYSHPSRTNPAIICPLCALSIMLDRENRIKNLAVHILQEHQSDPVVLEGIHLKRPTSKRPYRPLIVEFPVLNKLVVRYSQGLMTNPLLLIAITIIFLTHIIKLRLALLMTLITEQSACCNIR